MRTSGNVFYVFERMSPCHLLNYSTLGEYIFVIKYFQGTYFCELCLENFKFHGRYFVNTNQKFNFTKDIFCNLRPKSYLVVVLTSIKHYWTLFWQCFCLDLIFWKRHFRELATKSQKRVVVKISSTEISYVIYDTYSSNWRNEALSMFGKMREKQGWDNDSCHFSDQ